MRMLCFVLCLFALPASAAAQQSFSLPPIGGPLPSIGLRSHWQQASPPPWERRQLPAWEKNRIPPWERGYVAPRVDSGDQRRFGNHQRLGNHQQLRWNVPQVVYVLQPYPVEMQPQVVIVERPVTRIVEVEVPAREAAIEPPPLREPEPPFVPTGDRTLYVIPGCYVGNVSPKDIKLPPNCDLAKLTTFTP
jgi:hypothetical protein